MIQQYFYQKFPLIDLNDIILRELTDEDAEDYFQYMNKPAMLPFLAQNNIPSTVELALDEVRYWSSLFHNKRSFYWAIALKDTNQLIGTAGFNTISQIHSRAEISYDLDFNYWGKGIMLKAIKGILRFADYTGIVRTQATVIIDNVRSINTLERCGFIKEGLLKKYEFVNKQHKDYFMYSRVL